MGEFAGDGRSEILDAVGRRAHAEMRQAIQRVGVPAAGHKPEGFLVADHLVQSIFNAVGADVGDSQRAGGIMVDAMAHALGIQLAQADKSRWEAMLDELVDRIVTYALEVRQDQAAGG